MAELFEVIGSYTPLTRNGNEWEGACPFAEHEEKLSVIGERWRCACGAHDAGDNALAFLMAIGMAADEALQAVSDGREWKPTLTKPKPPSRPFGIEGLADAPEKPVLIVDSLDAAKHAGKLLKGYVVYNWPGGGERWNGLEPLKGRKLLLWPSRNNVEAFKRLEALVTDPAGLACTGKTVRYSTEETVENLTGAGQTGAELIAWVKVHVEELKAQPKPPQGSATAAPERPKRERPRLAAVDGNTALKTQPDVEHAPAPMSEDFIANAFADQQAEELRYVAARNLWLIWDDGYWKPDVKREVDRRVVEVCRSSLYWPDAAQLTPDGKRKVGSKSFSGHVRDLTMSDRRIAAEFGQFDQDAYLLGVPGGVVDLREGKLIEASREHYITRQTAVAPVKGTPENWVKFITHICKGDSSLVDYVQRWCGYLISGDTSEECLLFCYGPSQRGKSKFVSAMREMLGTYAVTAGMETFTETRTERHSEELASLAGARMVVASETESGRRWNEARIKALTGRDKIRARMLNENSFEFSLGKIVIAGNHAPALRNVDDTFRRRLHILEFSNPVPAEQVDKRLDEKLRAEYPQILQWCMEGFLAWQDCGLGKPEQITDAVEKYLEAEDTIGEWLSQHTESDPKAKTTTGDLYSSYKRFCDAAGEHAKSQKIFVTQISERGYSKARTASARYILGLRLTAEPPQVPSWHRD